MTELLNKIKDKAKLVNPAIYILLATLFSIVLALKQFTKCVKIQWISEQVFLNRCYSDIPALYYQYKFYTHTFPYAYGENSFEYPTGMALIAHLIGYITPASGPQVNAYFFATLTLIAAVFILTVLTLKQTPESSPYLFILAPASVYSLFINWDIFAILPLMLAILYFTKSKTTTSALMLALATSIKFIPVFVLLPINSILLKEKRYKEFLKYNAFFALAWLVINLPFAIAYPAGFMHFYIFNLERTADWGSYIYALVTLSPSIGHLLSKAFVGAILILFIIFIVKLRKNIDIQTYSFITIAAVMTVSNVYSPQYVIWLTALAAVIPGVRKVIIPFLAWQIMEMGYNISVWSRLANTTAPDLGIDQNVYSVVILLRIALLLYFAFSLYNHKKIATSK